MNKVLIIVAGNKGTIGRCSLNLFQAFKGRKDVEVKCVGIHRLKGGLEGFDNCEFYSDIYGNQERNIIKQVQWLRKIKKSFNPDMSISTLYSTNALNMLCGGRDYRVGVFHSPHYQGKTAGLSRYWLSLLEYWILFPKLDLCSCVSREVAEDLLHFKTIKKDRIKTIYNIHPIDEIVKKSFESVPDIPTSPYIVYCGRLDSNKAPMRAIRALYCSKADVKLLFVGKGEVTFVNEIRNKVDSLGVSDRVLFLGEKDNPYPYIKNANALISCSYSEGLPGVVIEALALGVPVVSTNSSRGVWEIFSEDASYLPDLDEVFETRYGMITSNHAASDKSFEEQDITNLAKGLTKSLTFGPLPVVEFLPLVSGKTITGQYLTELKSS